MGAEIGAMQVANKDSGLTKEEVMDIAKVILYGTAAIILLFEHLWAKRLKEIVVKQDGIFLAQGVIETIALVALGAVLAAAERLIGNYIHINSCFFIPELVS